MLSIAKLKFFLPLIGAFLLAILLRKKNQPMPDFTELKKAKLEVIDANKKKQQAEAQAEIDSINGASLPDWIQSELDQGGD